MLTLGTPQLSPFPGLALNRQKPEGRRKPLPMRAQAQWMHNWLHPRIPPFPIRITESWTDMGKEATSDWCLDTRVWFKHCEEPAE